MYRVLAVVLAFVLSGCGISTGIIKSDALDFGGIIEDTTNKLLVTNVLRARDKAPLHFADIPIVRESIHSAHDARVLGPSPATSNASSRSSGASVESAIASRSTISLRDA